MSINHALTTLLPTLHPLPPLLLSTAESLYSLSRQRAQHLQPEEEIARAHVCAEIAHRKLKTVLRLPVVKSGVGSAPCKPAVYKRLLGFLEGVLGDFEVSGTPKRVANKNHSQSQSQSRSRSENVSASTVKRAREDREREVDGTPTKKRKSGATAVADKPSSFIGRLAASKPNPREDTAEAPEYILPALRKLCKTCRTEKLILHAYTGVCVMLRLAELWPPKDGTSAASIPATAASTSTSAASADTRTSILALTISIYLLTLTRMQSGPMTTPLFEAICACSVQLLDCNPPNSSSEEKADKKDKEEKERRKKTTKAEIAAAAAAAAANQAQQVKGKFKRAIESWIARINAAEWTEDGGPGQDWWDSVPEEVIDVPSLPTMWRAQRTDREEITLDHDGESGRTSKRHGKEIKSGSGVDRQKQMARRKAALKRLLVQMEEDGQYEDVLLPGLGTMMNEAVDYGCEERRRRYKEWKEGVVRILERIQSNSVSASASASVSSRQGVFQGENNDRRRRVRQGVVVVS